MLSKKIILGSILCLIASMSWGAMFPVAHIALQKIDPFYFSFIRYLTVAIILSVMLWLKEGRSAFRLEGRGKSLLLFGIMAFTVYNMAVFLGQHLMGEPGTIAASIMEVLMPMISILIVWITTKKAPKKYMISSVAIALIGALLVITNGELTFFTMAGQHLIPLLLVFTGVVGWVIYSMGGERFKDWSTLRYSTLTCLLGSAVNLVIVTLASSFQVLPVPTWDTIFSIKYEMTFMVLLPGLVALLSWNAGIKMISSLNGILFINFVPITTFVIMAFQGYQISSFEIVGTLFIIFALLRNNMNQRKELRGNHTPKMKPVVHDPKVDFIKAQ
ncbi:DMT family transporter [Paenibacillus anaericanus]|uniref:DMT family transporter n=1 Tax=Paenibacillus anaericanus TaxID=170367 RepID=A0A433YBN5_9BACL|nr:DMT family transporter [Paenibacillus anaericanus]RUT47249.1 DMT family transporter [Paenibacillus anaericanus]